MSATLRNFVRDRAVARCEYCRLPDDAAPVSTFHIEHVIAKQHGGLDETANRAWCCQKCNLHKGPNLSGIDPLTDHVVRLFDPRKQSWNRHFEWLGAVLLGRTQIGRATVAVLNVNDPQRVALRLVLMENGDWPLS